jgi:hypothetical protein
MFILRASAAALWITDKLAALEVLLPTDVRGFCEIQYKDDAISAVVLIRISIMEEDSLLVRHPVKKKIFSALR